MDDHHGAIHAATGGNPGEGNWRVKVVEVDA